MTTNKDQKPEYIAPISFSVTLMHGCSICDASGTLPGEEEGVDE